MAVQDPALLAPYFTWKETYVTASAGTWTNFLKANPTRVAFMVSCPSGNSGATISTQTTGTTGNGLAVPVGTAALLVKYADVGSLVGSAWYTMGAGGSFTCIEVSFLPTIHDSHD